MAVDNNLGAAVGTEGAVGRIVQAWQARPTRHPCVIPSDTNMCPEDFEKQFVVSVQAHVFIKAPRDGVSTCRSKSPKSVRGLRERVIT